MSQDINLIITYISFEEVKEMFKKSIDETTNVNEALEKTVQLIYSKGYSDGKNDTLDKTRAEIEQQEKWLMIAGYNAYNVDMAFNAIKSAVSESEGE